jgi:hypothetical protein
MGNDSGTRMSLDKSNFNGMGDTAFRWISAACAGVLLLLMVGIMLQLIRYSGLNEPSESAIALEAPR